MKADYDTSPEGQARRQVQIIDTLERIEGLLIRIANSTAKDGVFIAQTIDVDDEQALADVLARR